MLLTRMDRDYQQPLRRCVVGFVTAPFSVKASFLDLTYNIGVGAACRSTAAKRITAKD